MYNPDKSIQRAEYAPLPDSVPAELAARLEGAMDEATRLLGGVSLSSSITTD